MNTPMRALEVLATGPLALVQDLGRPGLAALGSAGPARPTAARSSWGPVSSPRTTPLPASR